MSVNGNECQSSTESIRRTHIVKSDPKRVRVDVLSGTLRTGPAKPGAGTAAARPALRGRVPAARSPPPPCHRRRSGRPLPSRPLLPAPPLRHGVPRPSSSSYSPTSAGDSGYPRSSIADWNLRGGRRASARARSISSRTFRPPEWGTAGPRLRRRLLRCPPSSPLGPLVARRCRRSPHTVAAQFCRRRKRRRPPRRQVGSFRERSSPACRRRTSGRIAEGY